MEAKNLLEEFENQFNKMADTPSFVGGGRIESNTVTINRKFPQKEEEQFILKEGKLMNILKTIFRK